MAARLAAFMERLHAVGVPPALEVAAASHIGRLWFTRSENERDSSAAFIALDTALRELRATDQVLELSARAVDDEAFHAEVCLLMARLYDTELAQAACRAHAPPAFPVCSPRVHRTLFAALHSAVNETMAVPYLSACLADAETAAVRLALREILSDEVRHARLGWAVLASPELSRDDRASIAAFMPALLETCVDAWLDDDENLYGDDLPRGHGCIGHSQLVVAVSDAIRDLILPGLDYVGIDSSSARSWAESRAARFTPIRSAPSARR